MNEILRKLLVEFEGYKRTVYRDTVGLPTAGIGHMDKNMTVGNQISDAQIEAWYKQDVKNAIDVAYQCYSTMDSMTPARKAILITLAFNLGYKLHDFHNTNAAVNAGDWMSAANNLEKSKWYTQVGRRGPKTCDILRKGSL